MQKTLIIKYCDSCPFFDNDYYAYLEQCGKLDKEVPKGIGGEKNLYPIPKWCPLEEITVVEEKNNG